MSGEGRLKTPAKKRAMRTTATTSKNTLILFIMLD